MLQHTLIAAVRAAVAADPDLDAALMYGSFAKGEADTHSDVEFWLFHTPAAHAATDPRRWIAALGHPVARVLRNEFGAHVAVFDALVRGEFHFATTDQYPEITAWPERGAPVDAMLLLDRSGRLRPALEALPARLTLPGPADAIAEHCDPLLNWLILALHVLRRGELLRALDALEHARRHLLWAVRTAEEATSHWLTPSRAAENDLPSATVAALHAATAPAEPTRIAAALRATLTEGRRTWHTLTARDPHAPACPDDLLDEIDTALCALATH